MNTAKFFDDYFNNAFLNCMLIMDDKGVIQGTNEAFSNNFGYSINELNGQNFDVLFIDSDKNKNKPQEEIERVLNIGKSFDENYILNKDGKEIWVTGEAVKVSSDVGRIYIVKDVVNLQSKNHIDLFYIETGELMERIFEGNKGTAMLVLDGGGRLIKVNERFQKLFAIAEAPVEGIKTSHLNNPFWSSLEIREEIRMIVVTNMSSKRGFAYETPDGKNVTLRFTVKVLGREEKKIYIIIEEDTLPRFHQ